MLKSRRYKSARARKRASVGSICGSCADGKPILVKLNFTTSGIIGGGALKFGIGYAIGMEVGGIVRPNKKVRDLADKIVYRLQSEVVQRNWEFEMVE